MLPRPSNLVPLAAAIAAVLLSCSPRPDSPRLVLLYATCSLNRELLGPYRPAHTGRPRARTPNIDRFAGHSAVLRRHQTESGQSGTSFASIFTGLQAPRHQVYAHPRKLPRGVDVIGEYFQRGGYETFSWLGHVMANAFLGYAQGVPVSHRHGTQLLADDRDFLALLDELAANPSERAFAMTDFTVTHGPYRGHDLDRYCEGHREACAIRQSPGFARLRRLYRDHHRDFAWEFDATADRLALSPGDRKLLRDVVALLYAADVEYLDRIFGDVLAAIAARGLMDDSVIVFTADHGEVPVREGLPFRWTHGMQLAPDVLNVPTLISAPTGDVRPGPYDGVTRSIDILPTLLSLANLPLDALPGVDLSPALRGDEPPPRLTAFSHTALIPEHFQQGIGRYPTLQARYPTVSTDYMRVGFRRGDQFFQLAPDTETGELEAGLFDIAHDKGKTHNLFDADNPAHQQALRSLKAYRKSLADGYLALDQSGNLPPGQSKRRLRSLGYIE